MCHSQEIEFGSKDSPERSNAFKYVFDVSSFVASQLHVHRTESAQCRPTEMHGVRDSRG